MYVPCEIHKVATASHASSSLAGRCDAGGVVVEQVSQACEASDRHQRERVILGLIHSL